MLESIVLTTTLYSARFTNWPQSQNINVFKKENFLVLRELRHHFISISNWDNIIKILDQNITFINIINF